jgi:hypothetical protein
MNSDVISKFNIALDSCVIISLMGSSEETIQKIKSVFDEKCTKIILYDVVLNEVIGNGNTYKIRRRLSELFNYELEIVTISEYETQTAKELSEIYRVAYKGDDMILTLSKMRNDIVITFDKTLIKTCRFLGIRSFNPDYQDDFSVNLDAYGKTISEIMSESNSIPKITTTKIGKNTSGMMKKKHVK